MGEEKGWRDDWSSLDDWSWRHSGELFVQVAPLWCAYWLTLYSYCLKCYYLN